jgi:hypothetical protein
MDLQELFLRHDIEYVFKVNKKYSDIRLAYGIWQLLHWLPKWTRL